LRHVSDPDLPKIRNEGAQVVVDRVGDRGGVGQDDAANLLKRAPDLLAQVRRNGLDVDLGVELPDLELSASA